jgi:hypothetical protein
MNGRVFGEKLTIWGALRETSGICGNFTSMCEML